MSDVSNMPVKLIAREKQVRVRRPPRSSRNHATILQHSVLPKLYQHLADMILLVRDNSEEVSKDSYVSLWRRTACVVETFFSLEMSITAFYAIRLHVKTFQWF